MQLINCLHDIHSHKICQRDIKLDNVLVRKQDFSMQLQEVYIADFGLSEFMPQKELLK